MKHEFNRHVIEIRAYKHRKNVKYKYEITRNGFGNIAGRSNK